jgi:hypothetical protein
MKKRKEEIFRYEEEKILRREEQRYNYNLISLYTNIYIV